MAESLCWACTRACAKPDPEGCGWHRQEHEKVWDKADVKDSTYRKLGHTEGVEIVTVTKCKLFEKSARAQQAEGDKERKARRARANKRGRRVKYGADALEVAADMYAAGFTYGQIATKVGCPRTSVQGLIMRAQAGGREICHK